MDKKITATLAVTFATMFSFATISEGQNMDPNQALSAKQRSIISIAAFTANGDMEKLKKWGVDAVLVGESLVSASNVAAKMKELL